MKKHLIIIFFTINFSNFLKAPERIIEGGNSDKFSTLLKEITASNKTSPSKENLGPALQSATTTNMPVDTPPPAAVVAPSKESSSLLTRAYA